MKYKKRTKQKRKTKQRGGTKRGCSPKQRTKQKTKQRGGNKRRLSQKIRYSARQKGGITQGEYSSLKAWFESSDGAKALYYKNGTTNKSQIIEAENKEKAEELLKEILDGYQVELIELSPDKKEKLESKYKELQGKHGNKRAELLERLVELQAQIEPTAIQPRLELADEMDNIRLKLRDYDSIFFAELGDYTTKLIVGVTVVGALAIGGAIALM